MHDSHAVQTAAPALDKVVVKKTDDFRWPESMQIQFARDGNCDRLVGVIRRHTYMFGVR